MREKTHILSAELSETELVALASRLAQSLSRGDVVALWGDLGAGKTTFARALIRAFVGDATLEVPSPTFALRQDYAGAHGAIVHFDLYRITDARDLDDIGFADALAVAVVLVEWPDRAGAELPAARIDISLSDTTDPDRRAVVIDADAATAARLQTLAAETSGAVGVRGSA